MSRLYDIGVDNATARLIAAAKATATTGGVPVESGRSLLTLARGVRLYLEAWQDGLAQQALDQLDDLMAGSDDPLIVEAYSELCNAVRKSLRWALREEAS